MKTPLRLRWIEAGGVSTRCIEAGDGPPLILLHGTGGHLEAYSRNISALAAHFHVVAYDMLGHGFTSKPDFPYTIDRLSDHLIAVLDELEIPQAFLSGESLGAWVAAWTAAHHPDRVRRLVLNTPGNIRSRPDVMQRISDSSLRAVREASINTVRERIEWLFHDKSMVTDEIVAIRYQIYSQPAFLRAMENILVMQDPVIRSRYTWSRDWVAKIEAPTLILWTSADPTGTVADGRLLLEWLRDGRFEVIEDAGHWPQWEKPDEFLSVHLQFLDGTVPKAAKRGRDG
jgi:2-hydroxy-6-oxonona-2,4-dienedioate hydrolase